MRGGQIYNGESASVDSVSTIVAFGELMLRLKAPGAERLLQTPRLEATFGGAEFNVLASLRQWGHDTVFVTALPDSVLGDAAVSEILRFGVGTEALQRAPGRLGTYFAESGHGARSGLVLYDRAESVFARLGGAGANWDRLMSSAQALHLTGITPALSEQARLACMTATQAAVRHGKIVSMDVNYRASLWPAGGVAPAAALRPLLEAATIVFASAADLRLLLAVDPGKALAGDRSDEYAALSATAVAAFPRLRWIATCDRLGARAHRNELVGMGRDSSGFHLLPAQEVDQIVDRIGAGDAFAAGVLHEHLSGGSLAAALAYGVAAATLKHSIPGDVLRASDSEIRSVVAGVSAAKLRR